MKTTLESLNAKIEDMHEDVKEIKNAVLEQNSRVRKLEQFKSWFLGGLGMLTFLVIIGLIKIFG